MSGSVLLLAFALALLGTGCCCDDDDESSQVAPADEPVAATPPTTNTVRATPTPPRTPPPRPPAQPTVAKVPAADEGVPGQTFRVRFERGTSGADLSGAVLRGERNRYLLGASKGQLMKVSITATEDNATFSLRAPNGATIPGTEEERGLKQWQGRLPQDGDTVIVVGPTRGNATYTLKVEITSG